MAVTTRPISIPFGGEAELAPPQRYSAFALAMLWGGLSMSLLALLPGAYLVPALSLREAIVVAVAGSVFGAGLLAAVASIAAKRQQKLAWTIEPALDEQRRVTISLSIDGAKVSGFARHPLGREPDVPLTFITKGGESRSINALPQGRWDIHLLVRRGESEARLIETLP